MRIVILSTETIHHTYFINCIVNSFDVVGIFYEIKHIRFPFDTSSPFEDDEKAFENDNFFVDVPNSIPIDLPVHRVQSLNDPEFKEMAQECRADLALVFGCGKIRPHVFPLFKKGLINVHRGIATEYRGLDSDLWAIYHRDFENIGTTLHFVEEKLDTGDIIRMERINYTNKDKIFHLRFKTTLLAADMVADVISEYRRNELNRIKQTKYGRYYSAMPTILKSDCERKFNSYISTKF